MTTTIDLNVVSRPKGKHAVREARRNELTPAIVYGPQKENTILCIAERDVKKYFTRTNENAIFTLKSEDKNLDDIKVLIRRIDRHPLTQRPLHIDLYAADMTKTVRVNVPLQFKGVAVGTKTGGVLQEILREVEVECLPLEIPQFLVADISNLELNHSLKVSDVETPAGVEILTPADQAIATISMIAEEVIAAPTAAETPAEGAAAAATPAAGAPAAGAPAAGAAGAAAKKPEAKKEDKK